MRGPANGTNMEAIIDWKFNRLVQNMPLDLIADTQSEDRHSASSLVFDGDGTLHPPDLDCYDSDEFADAVDK